MRILVVLGHYLPGYKAGGPIRSIASLVDQLGDEFDFRILTSDRDWKDHQPYGGIRYGAWQPVGKAQVRYLGPEEQTWYRWRQLLWKLDYDLLYLNGYFAPLSVWTLWLRRFGQIPDVPVVLAPRGEFSPGALALKSYKKRPYLYVANRVNLTRGIVWHASSKYEVQDIQCECSAPTHVVVARPLVARIDSGSADATGLNVTMRSMSEKRVGQLRVVFLSRLVRKKNVDLALRLLEGVRGEITFDIYGTREDQAYWRECERIIGRLPANVRAQYRGEVLPDQVPRTLADYQLLLLPTRGENFGHVILEALSAGCPVLISDQTPWRGLEQKGIGWDVALTEPDKFRAILQKCVDMDAAELKCWSGYAIQFAARFYEEQKEATLQAYQNLFEDACESCG